MTAAWLSFLFPGLGQLYARRRRLAAVFAGPVVVLVLVVAAQALDGLEVLAARLLDPTVALVVLLAVGLLGAWRIASIGHALSVTLPVTGVVGPLGRATIGLLVAAVVAMHAVGVFYAWAFYDAGSKIFVAAPEPSPTPSPTPRPAAPSAGATPSAVPATPTPNPTEPPTDRLTILLTGVDSARDRNHALTDTLLVISVNRDTNEAVMLSLPRDIANFPLYSGGTFRGKINSLMSTAERNPDRYPDGAMGTLTRQVGFIIGIPIDHYASVNLDGFRRMVDLVGGVDVDNPRWINDPSYDWLDGTFGFRLSPGVHHLNGRTALAYVRSRMGAGDNDFTRAARQQQLLVALRSRLADPGIFDKLPAILDVASTTIRTDFPVDEVPENLVLAQRIGDDSIQRFVLGPPYSIHPPTSSTGGIYTLNLEFDRIEQLSIELFGADSAYAQGDPASTPKP